MPCSTLSKWANSVSLGVKTSAKAIISRVTNGLIGAGLRRVNTPAARASVSAAKLADRLVSNCVNSTLACAIGAAWSATAASVRLKFAPSATQIKLLPSLATTTDAAAVGASATCHTHGKPLAFAVARALVAAASSPTAAINSVSTPSR